MRGAVRSTTAASCARLFPARARGDLCVRREIGSIGCPGAVGLDRRRLSDACPWPRPLAALRPLLHAGAGQTRRLSGPKSGGGGSSSDFARIQGLVKEMLQGEVPGRAAPVSLPGGWEVVDTAPLMNAQLGDNGLVLLEKRLGSGETVNLVSSHEVLNSDDDIEDEEDGDSGHENGFKHADTSILFLGAQGKHEPARAHLPCQRRCTLTRGDRITAAFDRPGQALPLFFECVGDKYGYEILRVHVGLGMAGFMSDQSGHPALLYHVYMSHRDARQGRDNEVCRPLPDVICDSSPSFFHSQPPRQVQLMKLYCSCVLVRACAHKKYIMRSIHGTRYAYIVHREHAVQRSMHARTHTHTNRYRGTWEEMKMRQSPQPALILTLSMAGFRSQIDRKCVYMYACMHVFMYVCIHTTHTDTHTHTSVETLDCRL